MPQRQTAKNHEEWPLQQIQVGLESALAVRLYDANLVEEVFAKRRVNTLRALLKYRRKNDGAPGSN